MFRDLIVAFLEGTRVQELMGEFANGTARQLSERPGLQSGLERTAARQGELFAASELGLPPKLRYPTVYDFFDDYLQSAYELSHQEQRSRWCAKWWDHRAALVRVTAMWRGYEHLRLTDPMCADEQFLRFIGDHHMRYLTSEQSPMQDCVNGHKNIRPIPSTPMEADHG